MEAESTTPSDVQEMPVVDGLPWYACVLCGCPARIIKGQPLRDVVEEPTDTTSNTEPTTSQANASSEGLSSAEPKLCTRCYYRVLRMKQMQLRAAQYSLELRNGWIQKTKPQSATGMTPRVHIKTEPGEQENDMQTWEDLPDEASEFDSVMTRVEEMFEAKRNSGRKQCSAVNPFVKTERGTAALISPCWVCNNCKAPFKDRQSAEKHVKEVHGKYTTITASIMPLNVKNERLSNVPAFEQQETHEITNTFYCPSCNFNTNNRYKFLEHITDDRKENLCMDCNTICESDSDVKRHVQIHTQSKPGQKCMRCQETFGDHIFFDAHIVYCKKNPKQVKRKSNAIYTCLLCQRQDIKVSDMTEHLLRHRGTCRYCLRGFEATHALEIHMLSAHKLKLLRCTLCPDIFIKMENLYDHKNSHKNGLVSSTFRITQPDCQIAQNPFSDERHMPNFHNHHSGHPAKLENLNGEATNQWMPTIANNFKHETEKPNPGKEMHHCKLCSRSFKTSNGLKIHHGHKHRGINLKRRRPQTPPINTIIQQHIALNSFYTNEPEQKYRPAEKRINPSHYYQNNTIEINSWPTLYHPILGQNIQQPVPIQQITYPLESQDYLQNDKPTRNCPICGDSYATRGLPQHMSWHKKEEAKAAAAAARRRSASFNRGLIPPREVRRDSEVPVSTPPKFSPWDRIVPSVKQSTQHRTRSQTEDKRYVANTAANSNKANPPKPVEQQKDYKLPVLRRLRGKNVQNDASWKCNKCALQFTSNEKYLEHKNIHHAPRERQSSASEDSISEQNEMIAQCSNGTIVFICHICRDKFVSEHDLTAHNFTHTTNPKLNKYDGGKFNCTFCGMRLKSDKAYFNHVHTHDMQAIKSLNTKH